MNKFADFHPFSGRRNVSDTDKRNMLQHIKAWRVSFYYRIASIIAVITATVTGLEKETDTINDFMTVPLAISVFQAFPIFVIGLREQIKIFGTLAGMPAIMVKSRLIAGRYRITNATKFNPNRVYNIANFILIAVGASGYAQNGYNYADRIDFHGCINLRMGG